MRPSLLPALSLLLTAAAADDWRLDLLQQEGIGSRREELRKFASRGEADPAALTEALRELGAEDYPTRERAQQRILSGGTAALDWLRDQQIPADPEVRLRVAAIRETLEFPSIGSRDRMLSHAVESLLDAGAPAGSPATGGIFYEWFAKPSGKLGDSYRSCTFVAADGMGGRVTDGRLVLPGERPGDGDQRLILHATDWPGREAFPDRFRVSARLGGTPGGEGAWHLGITVGAVRALYHPGFDGGGFRFEQVGSRSPVRPNRNMGFTPSTRAMQRMVIDVRRLRDQRVKLAVRVEQEDGGRFEDEVTVETALIGPLGWVSLDRSGRSGGDARFDDFAVELGGR